MSRQKEIEVRRRSLGSQRSKYQRTDDGGQRTRGQRSEPRRSETDRGHRSQEIRASEVGGR